MPKNATKNRSYKVQSDFSYTPYLMIKGKFLEKLGLTAGSHLEMIETDGMLIFRKMTDTETSLKQFSKLKTTYKRCFNLCERHLETYLFDGQVKHNQHLQFLNHLKECGTVVTTLYTLSLNDIRKSNTLDMINEYKRQLAWCEQLFYEDDKSINLSQLETYKHLVGLLKDCGKQLGIFTKRNLFSFKHKRQLFNVNDHKAYYQHNFNPMMVAENRSIAYRVDDELAKHPEKYLQAKQSS